MSVQNISVCVQTKGDYNEELRNCQNQVKLLQQQVEKYRNEIVILKKEITNLKQPSNNQQTTTTKKDLEKVGITKTNALESGSASARGIKIRGCACKGNCSNKICGCVKKHKYCQDFCRCEKSLCYNQDQEKENVEQRKASQKDKKVLKKLENLAMNEKIDASEKKATRNVYLLSDNLDTTSGSITSSAGSLSFVTKRRFIPQRNNEGDDIKVNDEREKSLFLEKHYQEKNYLDHLNLLSNHLSTSNTQSAENILSMDKKTSEVNENQELNQESLIIQNVCMNLKSQQANHTNIKTIDVEQLQLPHDIIANCAKVSNGKSDIFFSAEHEIILHSASTREKLNCLSSDSHITKNQNNHYKTTIKMQTDSMISDELTTNKNGHPKFKRQPTLQTRSNNKVCLHKTSYTTDNKTNEKSQSNPVYMQVSHLDSEIPVKSKEGIRNSIGEISDNRFNPMIPTHELPRSPVKTDRTHVGSQDLKQFSPQITDFTVEEVDWEQHQAELILCDICKRKFFPYRIDKHRKSCLGI